MSKWKKKLDFFMLISNSILLTGKLFKRKWHRYISCIINETRHWTLSNKIIKIEQLVERIPFIIFSINKCINIHRLGCLSIDWFWYNVYLYSWKFIDKINPAHRLCRQSFYPSSDRSLWEMLFLKKKNVL